VFQSKWNVLISCLRKTELGVLNKNAIFQRVKNRWLPRVAETLGSSKNMILGI
jgi:hypothetical protein